MRVGLAAIIAAVMPVWSMSRAVTGAWRAGGSAPRTCGFGSAVCLAGSQMAATSMGSGRYPAGVVASKSMTMNVAGGNAGPGQVVHRRASAVMISA